MFGNLGFSGGKVHGGNLAGYFFLNGGRHQLINCPREPSECIVPHCICPCFTLPGGRVRIGWDPKPMPNFFLTKGI